MKFQVNRISGSSAKRAWAIAALVLGLAGMTSAHSQLLQHLTRGTTAPQHGVYEVELEAQATPSDPFAQDLLRVTFTKPDGSKTTVEGFYDGGKTYRARAYVEHKGNWSWASTSSVAGLSGKSGSFEVKSSQLKGKLRQHPTDSRQFAYANGEWFLHIGDTGYRYVHPNEPNWKAYIDQAAQMGATKIRTWFNSGRHDVTGLFAENRKGLALAFWQTIDQRVLYALENHPHLNLQLIPFGEDSGELRRFGDGDVASKLAIRYFQARYSALPNVQFCISNDRDLSGDLADDVKKIGVDMAGREPWGTLLTNHQKRFSGYAFVNEPWSDIITLETLEEANGAKALEYRGKGNDPVVNDEDGYETYRGPSHARYWFRRFMWAHLFSGAHATYGGLRTYEANDGKLKGMHGYYDAVKDGRLKRGADDFVHIHKFFRESGLTLVGMTPDDAAAGNKPDRYKCIHNTENYLVYLSNHTGTEVMSYNEASSVPEVEVSLPAKSFQARWYDPAEGMWTEGAKVSGGKIMFKAPSGGDWVLWLGKEGSTVSLKVPTESPAARFSATTFSHPHSMFLFEGGARDLLGRIPGNGENSHNRKLPSR